MSNENILKNYIRYEFDPLKRLRKYAMVWGSPYGPPAEWRAGAPLGNGNFGHWIAIN